MKINRRKFLKSAALGSIAAHLPLYSFGREKSYNFDSVLDEILQKPILKKELFSSPVILENVELLRYKNNFI